MVFAALLASVGRVWPRFVPAVERPRFGGVDGGTAPVDLVRVVQLGQEHGVQRHPHPGFVPVAQPLAAPLAAAPAQFGGQVNPADARLEHKNDPVEHRAVGQGQAGRDSESGGAWGAGKIGSISAQSSSSTRGLAMRLVSFPVPLRFANYSHCRASFLPLALIVASLSASDARRPRK